MICYLDTTFCCSPNCKNECGRQLTQQVELDAAQWWRGFNSDHGPPIAVSYFCGGEPEKQDGEQFTHKGN